MSRIVFNTPPGWPEPPEGWVPPPGWEPDPNWPAAPADWKFWKKAPAAAPDHPATRTPSSEVKRGDHAGARPTGTLPLVDDGQQDGQRLAPPRDRQNDLSAESPSTDLGVGGSAAGTVAKTPNDLKDGLADEIEALRAQLIELNDAVLLQQVGIYEYHHPAENSEAYKESLAQLQQEIREAVRQGRAIEASDRFAYNNSLAQGRKMTRDFSRLMLRAYNAEADNCVRSVRAASVESSKTRLSRAAESIAKLGSMMEMRVTPRYHELRLREIELTGDYMMMKQEERERAREERERLREERKAELELQAERDRLEKEREHYSNSLRSLEAQGRADEAEALKERLAVIADAIAANDYRIANIRAGYVYVISNMGAFGREVVKIGLTRRLDPLDRVRELGDASVPFPFDVHALYFSGDAVELENYLHKTFAARRVNHVNLRREFFFVTPEEVKQALVEKVGNLLDFQELPTAEQYHQSLHYWPQHVQAGARQVE